MQVAKLTTKAMIWFKTMLVAGVYVIAIAMVFAKVFSKTPDTLPFLIALSFLAVQTGAIVALIAVVIYKRVFAEIKAKRERKILPVIRELLAAHTLGDDRLAELRELNGDYPDEVEQSLAHFLTSFTGEARDRISELAVNLGLLRRWVKRSKSFNPARREEAILRIGQLTCDEASDLLFAALKDDEPGARTEAYRALIRSEQPDRIAQVFPFIASESLLVRALLVDELQPHALFLIKAVIPELISSNDAKKIMATFELIGAWKNILPLADVFHLLDHSEPEVRAKALRALSYTMAGEELEIRIINAFEDEHHEVKIAAAYAAARLKIEQALEKLEHCLQDAREEVRRAAAYALAQLGAKGTAVLEREMLSANHYTASTALEMLERVYIDRCEVV
ncbi:MAG: HEAT repeat domain-containing protein [Acidobacteriota bacterium]